MKPLALLLLPPPPPPLRLRPDRRPSSPPPHPSALRAITDQMRSHDLVFHEGCYTVNHYANVSHALTLIPGTTITFGGGAQLAIETNGSLEAIGTAEKPILLRGKDATAGYWVGVTFNSCSPQLQKFA